MRYHRARKSNKFNHNRELFIEKQFASSKSFNSCSRQGAKSLRCMPNNFGDSVDAVEMEWERYG